MKKWMAKREKFSVLSLPLCWFSLVFLDLSFRYIYRGLSALRVLSPQPVAFTLCWALVLTGLISLLPTRGRRAAMVALGLFFSLLVIVHGAMVNIFGHLFSFSDLSFAGEGVSFFSWSYLRLRKLFLLCVLLFLLMMVLAAMLTRSSGQRRRRLAFAAAGILTAALSLIPIWRTHQSLMPAAEVTDEGAAFYDIYSPDSVEYAYKAFSNPNACMMMTGLYQYTFRNLTVSLGLEQDRDSIARLDAYYAERAESVSGENEMTGALKGKNLIMVMVESLDSWMISPDFTPNLYRLQQEGVSFPNFYTPLFLSAGTFNTEIITQTGQIPPVSGMRGAAYSTNSFPLSLGNLFAGEGYAAESFHAAPGGVYNRENLHPNLGYGAYHGSDEMGMTDYMLDSQMIGGYDLMAPEGSFFSFLITFSGHGPYNEELGNIAAPYLEEARAAVAASGEIAEPWTLEEYARAIAHIRQTDALLGELVARLEADGRLEDTVLLVFGDHYAKYMTQTDFLHRLKGVTWENPQDLYNTPCFLYGGGLAPMTVDKVCSTVDLVPTLVNLFDLPADRRYYPGDDIFGDRGGIVMFPDNAWYDGTVYYSDRYTGPVTPEMTAVTEELSRRVNASMDSVRCDYFRSLRK